MDEEILETNEDGEQNSGDLVKKLREKLKVAEEKAQEYLGGWQKERAEGVNARKRMEEEKREFAKFANENLIMEILPALDSFDLAMSNKEEWSKLPSNWTRGIEYIYTQLLSALEANGVKRLYPLHEKFDPSRDEALSVIPVEKEDDDHKIVEVVQPGYSFNNKTLRTAKVKVAEFAK
ncbi:MAG: nucleotide exchange factor GrpE [Patescibacteria group bacterium]